MRKRFHRINRAVLVLTCCSIALIAFFWIQTAHALDPARSLKRYGHNVWQREQGLPNNTIRVILQTRDGYIWLGTEEGLARFDGVHFKIFDSQNTPEISSNQIKFLLEDQHGRLWIGTTGGLTRFENLKFTAFTASDGLSDSSVSSICEDRDGDVWIGTAAGLNRFRDGRFEAYT